MNILISELENILRSEVINMHTLVSIDGISIDSRTINKNELFIAIKGDNHDGHLFINDAIKNGASLIISENTLENFPCISVDDTTDALASIAKFYADKIHPIVIGITGTNGKTSVTNMTSMILRTCKQTLSTYRNYNNQIGLPLSILKGVKEDEVFVLEMGASKVGDIKELIKIAKPTIVALLNVSPAHMDSFKSIENIIKTKEEILSYQGYLKTVILSLDDDNFQRWSLKANKNRIVTISVSQSADYYISSSNDHDICVKTPYSDIINLYVNDLEPHTLNNILFSIALSYEAGARSSNVIKGLHNYNDVDGRFGIKKGHNGSKVIDSSYNANPQSFIASINSLVRLDCEPWLVMGEMGELGENSELYHKQVARYAYNMGVKKLFVISKHASTILDEFGQNSYAFDSTEALIIFIKPQLNDNVSILVKASRFMKFEIIVNALTERKN
jgi:UDP-N-acetylmuramoyl-tripeptide--D-alanyl-D-alanine ligase